MLNDIKSKKFGKIYSLEINFGHGHNPKILSSWKMKKICRRRSNTRPGYSCNKSNSTNNKQ